MTALDLLRAWLLTEITKRKPTRLYGHWLTYDADASKQYIALRDWSAAAPPEVSTRWAQIGVTLVGAKDSHVSTISPLAEQIMAKTELIPAQCAIVQVNALTDWLGPYTTEGKRPVLTITLELILGDAYHGATTKPDCGTTKTTGKQVAVDINWEVCGNVADPRLLEFKPLGGMRGKDLDMSQETEDVTDDRSVGDYAGVIGTTKTLRFPVMAL